MRKLLLPLVVVGLLSFNTLRADAIPVCFPQDEQLDLSFRTAAYNGVVANHVTGGRYTTDGGVEFYVSNAGVIDAVPDAGQSCMSAAKQVTVRLIDPWSGESRTLTLGGTP